MNWFQEKLFYSATLFLSSGCLWLGTILTVGDVRWLYATGAASLMTSGFVGLALRKDGDSIRILISRTGIGLVGGVFGTKLALHYFSSLDHIRLQTDTDVILLCGIATIVAAVTHILGFAIIKSADDSAQNIASRLLDRLLMFFGITRPQAMKPRLIPPFAEGQQYRQLHPTREGKHLWRYVTLLPVRLPIHGIVPDDAIVTFHSADGVKRGHIDSLGIVLSHRYAWNGCTPKRWVWPFGWIGTPDYPSTILASAFHDMLYQFSRTEHFPLNRTQVDAIFYHCIAMSGSPKIAGIYHTAVRKFGSWTDKPKLGEYSTLE